MTPPPTRNEPRDSVAYWATTWGVDVYRYCRRLLKDDVEAEDVTQLVFIQALKDFQFQRQPGSARNWLYSIARNRCLDRLKMRQDRLLSPEEEAAMDVPTDAPPPDDALASSQAARQLSRCLDQLTDHSRAAVVLSYRDGLTYAEMSRITGVAEGALRVRVARALPVLRKCLEAAGIEW